MGVPKRKFNISEKNILKKVIVNLQKKIGKK
jgi:hypothetical protein